MLYNNFYKNDHSPHTPIICKACGTTFDLPNEFLPSLENIACGQCDIRGSFREAIDNTQKKQPE